MVDPLPATLGPTGRRALQDHVRFLRVRFGDRGRELRRSGSRARGEIDRDGVPR